MTTINFFLCMNYKYFKVYFQVLFAWLLCSNPNSSEKKKKLLITNIKYMFGMKHRV